MGKSHQGCYWGHGPTQAALKGCCSWKAIVQAIHAQSVCNSYQRLPTLSGNLQCMWLSSTEAIPKKKKKSQRKLLEVLGLKSRVGQLTQPGSCSLPQHRDLTPTQCWDTEAGLTCFLMHWRTVIAEPLWSARMRMVIPVRGLLTATIPSLPPDKIISPVVKGEKRMGWFL